MVLQSLSREVVEEGMVWNGVTAQDTTQIAGI